MTSALSVASCSCLHGDNGGRRESHGPRHLAVAHAHRGSEVGRRILRKPCSHVCSHELPAGVKRLHALCAKHQACRGSAICQGFPEDRWVRKVLEHGRGHKPPRCFGPMYRTSSPFTYGPSGFCFHSRTCANEALVRQGILPKLPLWGSWFSYLWSPCQHTRIPFKILLPLSCLGRRRTWPRLRKCPRRDRGDGSLGSRPRGACEPIARSRIRMRAHFGAHRPVAATGS